MKISALFLNVVFSTDPTSTEAAEQSSTTVVTTTGSDLAATGASSSSTELPSSSTTTTETPAESEPSVVPVCPPQSVPSVEYDMKIKTTGDLFAGTDDPVYIMFNGENVSTKLTQIPDDPQPSDFERGQTDEFTVTVTGIDEIKSATIIKPGNDRWYVEDFSLTAGNSTLEFDCFKTRVDGSQKPLVCTLKEDAADDKSE
ncbi:Oidioi.mRNA.OKI2018_I69.XSR.g16359.t1.cds [Oikopleura dioica]|uniref:Oidioi.mRNA.OKI2018_I69.XSR.g16359.t1.cds n=1 Tax=Oikopleura dioica TaxID=34765 RepID=A0ABN7SFU4_OIKDI|nr:Oidioi.mRNA.OKI2018_I69.XSR.g16359.t1.cds [Oikopleura dioica]